VTIVQHSWGRVHGRREADVRQKPYGVIAPACALLFLEVGTDCGHKNAASTAARAHAVAG